MLGWLSPMIAYVDAIVECIMKIMIILVCIRYLREHK